MNISKNIILAILLLPGYCSFAQKISTIDKLDSCYQTCLDNGINMLGCSQLYYRQMDSMLNNVYNKLRIKYDSSQQRKLKEEQIKWLASRDKYFTKVSSGGTQDEGLTGEDRAMNIIDKKANFVRDRVIELIKRL